MLEPRAKITFLVILLHYHLTLLIMDLGLLVIFRMDLYMLYMRIENIIVFTRSYRLWALTIATKKKNLSTQSLRNLLCR